MSLHFEEVTHLTPNHLNGYADATCPRCSVLRKQRNRRKPVLRVWYKKGMPTGFKCVHCHISGAIVGGHPTACDRVSAHCLRTDGLDASLRNIHRALRIWRTARPVSGTPAETYLREVRGIDLRSWPDDLRFHPQCPRGHDRRPALVALMRDIRTSEPSGIHRTFIARDGRAKEGSGGQARMMLGRAKVAVVKLTPDEAINTALAIAEGVETALSCIGVGLPVWASLSCGGIEAFPVLSGVEVLTILADHDPAGLSAAFSCYARWIAAGREVHVRRPLLVGADFNDALSAA